MNDGIEIQAADTPSSFSEEIKVAYSNAMSVQSRPPVQSCNRARFGAKQGTANFGIFFGNIGRSTVQDRSFDWSRYSRGEDGFGSALCSGDCPQASWFGHSYA